ncbi:MAG TPA: MFS transporter [Candidatus Limnocylindrales bacterium]|nr:MFS transporter [Candidatus Limnocylindrales bacterium]
MADHGTAQATPHPGGLFSAGRRGLTIGLVLTITLVAFESLAVATAMPIVARELGGIELYGWVFSLFFLGDLVGIVVMGLLIDRGGLVRPFGLGLGLFAIGLLIGGSAPSMAILIAGRLLQGFGAGGIAPVAYVAIARVLPDALRPRMFATLSTAWVLPGVIGPALSGLIAEHISWRFVFLGLLPLIAIAAALTIPALARVDPAPVEVTRSTSAERRRLAGALVLAVGAGLVLVGLTMASLFPGLVLVLVGIAIGLPAFRTLTPAGTLSARRGLPAATLIRGVLTFAFFSVDAYVPLLLIGWRGIDASLAGIALTVATLTWTGAAWVQARYVLRLGAGRFVTACFAIVLLAIAILALVLSPGVPIIVASVAWGIAGIGMGLGYASLTLIVLAEAPPEGQGMATAGLQLSDVLGTALGTGMGGAVIAFAAGAGQPASVGLAGVMVVGALVGCLGLVLSGRLRAQAAPIRTALEAR